MRLLVVIFILFSLSGFEGAKKNMDVKDYSYRLKAAFIYNFATLVDWPSSRKTGDFVIAIYGDDEVYQELKSRYSVKSVGSQKVKVVKYSDVAEISKSHILFVGEQKGRDLSTAKSKTSSYNTLLVSEAKGGLQKGAIINFIGPGGVNYEISKSNAKKHDLVVASRLLNLAKKVE
ncbi:MAG: YfiR family protein [Crocinitomicaceae bacterium]